MSRRAGFPWRDGRPPHLPCGPGEVAEDALLPGDPARVGLAATMLDDVIEHGQRREFRSATGAFGGTRMTLCSTGIGGPSTEIAAVELANLGVRRAIRIGGMGALSADLPLGCLLIVAEACGGTGAARAYNDATMQAATPEVVAALAEAARRLDVPHRIGRVMTTDSYYLGQGRPLLADAPDDDPGFIARLQACGIDGLDMECETLFAVGSRLGLQVGAVLAVHGNRATDLWLEDYETAQRDVVRVAATALRDLARAS